MHSYRIAGLRVASEIDLAGLIERPLGMDPPDVTIRLGAVPPSLEGAHTARATFDIAGDLFLLRIPGIARFLLTAGREMRVEAERGATLSDVAIFITGSVFGILLHQREQVVLHASAVRVGTRAVLFCGASGAGKSTMAAALGQRGYAMLTDDFCAVTIGASGVPQAQSDGRLLKLWARSVEKLDLGARRGTAVRPGLEKFYVEPHAPNEDALPIGAVYVLRETRSSMQDGIEALNLAVAARQVRRNAYRQRMVRLLRQHDRYLKSAAAILGKAGMFYLSRPFDYDAMPGVIDGLERHWRQLGLLEAAR